MNDTIAVLVIEDYRVNFEHRSVGVIEAFMRLLTTRIQRYEAGRLQEQKDMEEQERSMLMRRTTKRL